MPLSAAKEDESDESMIIFLIRGTDDHQLNTKKRHLPVAVVGEFVVTGQGEESSKPGAQGEENLSGSINPNLPKGQTKQMEMKTKREASSRVYK